MRQGGEPQGVQVVRQGEPTPYHCNFNPLYFVGWALAAHALYPQGQPENAWATSAHPTKPISRTGLICRLARIPADGISAMKGACSSLGRSGGLLITGIVWSNNA